MYFERKWKRGEYIQMCCVFAEQYEADKR